MSVLIKGMEMPKDCRVCPLCNYHLETGETWCEAIDGLLATDYRSIPFDGRDPDCPLVEIKTPHGRLADVDDLITAFPVRENSMSIMIASVRATINHAQTVIEAEEESDA